jgi:hypothetical protein
MKAKQIRTSQKHVFIDDLIPMGCVIEYYGFDHWWFKYTFFELTCRERIENLEGFSFQLNYDIKLNL